jgi:hypothetical protein
MRGYYMRTRQYLIPMPYVNFSSVKILFLWVRTGIWSRALEFKMTVTFITPPHNERCGLIYGEENFPTTILCFTLYQHLTFNDVTT